MIRSRTKAGWPRRLMAIGIAGLLATCAQLPQAPRAQDPNSQVTAGIPALAPAAGASASPGAGIVSPTRPLLVARLTPTQPDQLASIAYSDAAVLRRSLGKTVDRRMNLELAQGNIEWSVVDDYKRPLPLLRSRRGDGAFQLGVTEGAPFCLVFRNLGERNYEVVATVDGLDVLGGKAGSTTHRGYLLAAHDELVIKGFRKSSDAVAPFRFAAPRRAHAGKTEVGDGGGVGVLDVSVFRLGEVDAPASQRTAALQGQQIDLFPIGVRSGSASPPRQRN